MFAASAFRPLLTATAVLLFALGNASRSLSGNSMHRISSESPPAAHFSDTGCFFYTKTNTVDCANLSLVAVPAGIPTTTKILDLSDNRISQITQADTANLTAVEVIYAQNGILQTVSTRAFVDCTSLRSLYLEHNQLASISFITGTDIEELYINHNRIVILEAGNATLSLTKLDLSFNYISHFNSSLLSVVQNVQILNLSHNRIKSVVFDDAETVKLSRLKHFDVSANSLSIIKLCSDCYLYSTEHLDLSSNSLRSVDHNWCRLLPNLTVLTLGRNPISHVVEGAFEHCESLLTLHMDQLLIKTVCAGTFKGLGHLKTLRLDNNKRLTSLHRDSFADLQKLTEIQLRGCSLMSVDAGTFLQASSLAVLDVAGNPWDCHCDATIVPELSALSTRGVLVPNGTNCVGPPSLHDMFVLNVSSDRDECRRARPLNPRQTIWAHIGVHLLIDCNAAGDGPLSTTWIWQHNWNSVHVQHQNRNIGSENGDLEAMWNGVDAVVLTNGSLYIGSVTRSNAGIYYCIVSNEFGNGTMVVSLRLNSDIISTATLHSIIIGLLSAAAFFLVAVIIGIARYLAYICSTKERRKRKSIRAVLESLQDYKSAQFDRFSAYRTAKMDQLSAFKSAKIEQLSAFRDARVDRLRTYKQATVASILTHIERMREHYTAQTARIKDNCTQQAERLRERYTARRGRFKNYRSHQVDKMRENYTAQAARIREYGVVQMSRLREQYKTQQQYVLKLVELLDVGSCVSGVIEAECMKAESMIFDADIAFDFEAQAAHANESLMGANLDTESELSHYATASDSDLSLSSGDHNVTCIADVSVPINGGVKTDFDDVAGVLAVAEDVLAHLAVDENSDFLTYDIDMDPPAASSIDQDTAPSSSGNAAEASGNCLELEGIPDIVTSAVERPDEAAEQDTSC